MIDSGSVRLAHDRQQQSCWLLVSLWQQCLASIVAHK
jgi:hypothetical protein